jgi:hypothetical protein
VTQTSWHLGTIGALAVLLTACSEISVRSHVPSPDGRFVATVWTEMGGGAAGWCKSYLAVTPADASHQPREGIPDGYVVAEGQCGDLDPIAWTSTLELLVHYKTALRQEIDSALDGQVRVSYRSP